MKTVVIAFLSLASVVASAHGQLTSAQINVLAQRAAAAVREDRTPENAQCMIESTGTIRCSWSLPTNYSDDTLNAVFSPDDGSVIEASIDPGC